MFLYQVSLGASVDEFVRAHGFFPEHAAAALTRGAWGDLTQAVRTAVTSVFLHGGWLHLIGNVLYLRVFGDNVEDRLGHVGYLCFYLLGGVCGAGGHLLVDPESSIPLVGGSGAIAAVLGAYIVFCPMARVVTLFPIFVFLTFIEVPAILFLGIWSAQQLLNGYLELRSGLHGGVAWFAHLGGFGFGVVAGTVVKIFGRRRQRRSRSK